MTEGETPSGQPAGCRRYQPSCARPGRVGDASPHILRLSAGLNHYRRAV